MEQRKHFSKLNAEEKQAISLKVVKAISLYLQLFISPIIVRGVLSAYCSLSPAFIVMVLRSLPE